MRRRRDLRVRHGKGAAMQLGMVGLGRMGANMVQRLVADGHTCVVYDVNADAVAKVAASSDAMSPKSKCGNPGANGPKSAR